MQRMLYNICCITLARMPRIVDSTERRAAVTAAARRVIAREGLGAASVRRVAEEAGSSTTVVTHWFDDKHALLRAAVGDAYVAAEQRMLGHVEAGLTGLAALRAILLEALPIDTRRRDEARVWMAFWAAATVDPDLRSVQREGYRGWRDLLALVLVQAQEAGELAPGVDLEAEGNHLLCLVDGLLLQATLEPRRLGPKRQVAQLDHALARLAR